MIRPERMIEGLRILVVWLLMAGLAGARTYYVAVDGSDAQGDGSDASPWATITHALDSVPDQSLVLVKPGTYTGRIRLRGTFGQGVTVAAQIPYQARLRNDATVVTCYYGKGIALEGFDIAHSGPGAGALVVQIQDLAGGDDAVSDITIRNNILHDSFNNDILKINNGATRITVEGNMFYNQSGSDEHIDINSVARVTVQDNVFFNDFEGSGRVDANDTGSTIVIKDSNGDSDAFVGSRDITVRRNVFLNWQGSTGSNFVLVGEDGNPYFEGRDVLVENNLMLGNSVHVMRAPFGVKGGKDILFRHNTIAGDLPSMAYAMRLNTEGSNPANENIRFFNNIWSDPSGTMGATAAGGATDFSDTPVDETLSYTLDSNLYWNGGLPIPEDAEERINPSDDARRRIADPRLGGQNDLVLPRWDEAGGRFADGSATVRQAFKRLVGRYGRPAHGSPAVDAAAPEQAAAEDILGKPRPRGAGPDIGAVEQFPVVVAPLLHLLLSSE